jgi:predicted nucleotidyltransferase
MAVAEGANVVLQRLKEGLADLYGERLWGVILYGSYARGDAGEDSDIDVLIVLRGSVDARTERKRTLDLIANLSLEHRVLISDIITSEEDYSRGEVPLFREVQREGVPL